MKQEELEIGSTFAGRFLVERRIGAGGMGVVYQVRHQVLRRTFAIKLMRGKFARDPSTVARFQREARAASRIDHPNILSVLDFGRTQEGSPYLVMEYIEGDDLALILSRERRLSIARTLDIVAQIADALISAHAQKVVHRDLKPDNVFVAKARREGVPFTVKVLDFGIASLCASGASIRASRSIGTPLWMAPEQATLDTPITAATDVWALGLVAYYLVTGKSYWRAGNDDDATVSALLTEVLFGALVPASSRAAAQGASVPRGFDRWFAACVARDPRLRFPDANAAGRAFVELVLFASRSTAGSFAVVAPPRAYAPPPRPVRSYVGYAAIAIAVAAVASLVPSVLSAARALGG